MLELRHFFRHRWAEMLIAGVWLQSIIAAAFTGNLLVFVLASVGGLVLLAVVFSVVGWVRQRRRPKYDDSEAFAMSRQAMIFTLGRQKSTTSLALQAQHPAWLGLLCSRDTETVANEIAVQSGLAAECIQIETVDPWSVADVRRQTSSLLDWLALKRVDPAVTVVDITGGTAIMSVGAFSVAAERQIDCQYIRSDYDLENKVIPGTQRGVFAAHHDHQVR